VPINGYDIVGDLINLTIATTITMAATTSSSSSLESEESKSHIAEITEWQSSRQSSCRSVDGMLALAGLHWFTPDIKAITDTNTGITIGCGEQCTFQLPSPSLTNTGSSAATNVGAAILGRLYTRGMNVSIVMTEGLVEGKDYKIDDARNEAWPANDADLPLPSGAIALSSDGELPAKISTIYIGGAPNWPIAFNVVKRDYKKVIAIRVRDKASPALLQFTGIYINIFIVFPFQ
jgi:hypothetical protein